MYGQQPHQYDKTDSQNSPTMFSKIIPTSEFPRSGEEILTSSIVESTFSGNLFCFRLLATSNNPHSSPQNAKIGGLGDMRCCDATLHRSKASRNRNRHSIEISGDFYRFLEINVGFSKTSKNARATTTHTITPTTVHPIFAACLPDRKVALKRTRIGRWVA
jgi:hypothetical protein